MIQKSTSKDEMIKVFQDYGIVKQLNAILSRRDVDLYDYDSGDTSIVKLLKTLVDFADNHPDSSIRTELEQGEMFENLTAIVKSNNTDYRNRRVVGQIIETCFQHRAYTASSSIRPYTDNAEIDTRSGMAGYAHGEVRTLVEMQYIQYMQSILCKPMWWIDITNQHIVEQWRTDSLDRNISPSTFNLALEQLGVFVKQLVCNGSDGLGTIVPGPVELTYILDNGIPDNVYTRLMTNVSDIEHGSNHNTGQMVHNLIDASMDMNHQGIQTMVVWKSDTQVIRPVYVPTLPEHFEPKYESAKPVSLRGRNLQVIVKLTNIQLTPSKPKYDKGNWHIEGPINESIAAIGLYYYDVENITTPKLDYRAAVDFYYQRASDMYWKDVYDIDQESPQSQYIGSLEVPNGRCVVYPNRYQHKEQSFELADPTQPGHCKILTFFVVNPTCRIVSTAHVAPQQSQWYNSSLDKTPIPPELWNDATQYIQGVQSPAEAKHYRDELTSDRIQIIKAYNEYRYEQV
ncbi:hypothetical protein BDEG_24642 [Batrachochytrium dendrobatidis JEL423]|uniref:DUF4246 domain-containing protein n=1 Tax=Batrachochytrium dendrobatidis (strain JEL423) TaxID=403673 RepID=A0A177WNN9_BATDL|nr:hypothetical protein BDEG_24642 [Batrachochytrium dendrobatidis JEL423]